MPPEQVAALVSLDFVNRTAKIIFFDGSRAADRAYAARNLARQDKPNITHTVHANDAAEEIYIATHASERTL